MYSSRTRSSLRHARASEWRADRFRYESLDEEGNYSDPQYVADCTAGWLERCGFRDVKLENGVLEPEMEIDTVRRIRETCGDSLRHLRVDPNQVWSVETSIRTLQKLEPYDIEFCEDPTWGIEGMSLVRQSSRIPLATNMCCISFEQIPLAVRTHALDIILGDMHFWGGPTALLHLAKGLRDLQHRPEHALGPRARRVHRGDPALRCGSPW